MYLRRDADRSAYEVLCAMLSEQRRRDVWKWKTDNPRKHVIYPTSTVRTHVDWTHIVVYGGDKPACVLFIERSICRELWSKILCAVATSQHVTMPTSLMRIAASVWRGPGAIHASFIEAMLTNRTAVWRLHLFDEVVYDDNSVFAQHAHITTGPALSASTSSSSILPAIPLTLNDEVALRATSGSGEMALCATSDSGGCGGGAPETSPSSSCLRNDFLCAEGGVGELGSPTIRHATREGARCVPVTLPCAREFSCALRAAVCTRLFCEYALTQHSVQSSAEALAMTKVVDDEQTLRELGVALIDANVSALAAHADTRSCFDELGTLPALYETDGASAERVQRLYETVLVGAHHIRVTNGALPSWIDRRRGDNALHDIRLYIMTCRLFNLLLSHDDDDGGAPPLVECEHLSADASDEDVRVVRMIVERMYDVHTIMRYCQMMPLDLGQFSQVTRCVVSIGHDQALAFARLLSMNVQRAAVEHLVNEARARGTRLVTVTPYGGSGLRREQASAAVPTSLELGAIVRAADPSAREGIDFVIVWSPGQRHSYALLVDETIWQSMTYATVPFVLCNRRRRLSITHGDHAMNLGDCLARTLRAYERNECSAKCAAVALHVLARMLEFTVYNEDAFVGDEQVRAAIVRIERVLALIAGDNGVASLVRTLFYMFDGKRPSFLATLETLLTPHAEDVFLAMHHNSARNAVPPWLSDDAQLWTAFFEHEQPSKYMLSRCRERNNELNVAPLHDVAYNEDDHGIRGRPSLKRERDAAQASFRCVGAHGCTYRAVDAGHTSRYGPHATVRSMTPSVVVERDYRAHLDLIDRALVHASNPALILRELRVSVRSDPTSWLYRVPLACRVPRTPYKAYSVLRTRIRDVATELHSFDVTLANFVRILTAVSDVYYNFPPGHEVVVDDNHRIVAGADVDTARLAGAKYVEDERLHRAYEHVYKVLVVEPTFGDGLLPVLRAEMAGSEPDSYDPVERLVHTPASLPRPLAFAQPYLVEGVMANFFYGIAQ